VELLRDEGYAVRGAGDGFKALGLIEESVPDLLITDVHMPGMDGITLMQKVHETYPHMGVIVMTAHSTVERAVEAMRLGADDYLTKPILFDELLVVIDRILHHRETLREIDKLRSALDNSGSAHGWIGQSKASREAIRLLTQIADSPASVLLFGEAGTGKHLAAKIIHESSSRKTGPLVTVHCCGMAEDVINEEIFGLVDDGNLVHRGRLAEADGGTLFLNEVIELPASSQARLSRFLQEDAFTAVGSDAVLRSDIRLIASTSRPLHDEVRAGRFREDLFYRLNVINVRLPTLRERIEDITVLAMHFLKRHAARNRKDVRGFSERALDVLAAFDWPGNIRQLENSIERAVVVSDNFHIEPRDFPREIMAKKRDPNAMPIVPGASMAELERYAIVQTLESVGGSTSRAAKILGISPRTIQYRMNEYREHDPSGIPAVVPTEEER
jgi:two-component system response regulator HydG